MYILCILSDYGTVLWLKYWMLWLILKSFPSHAIRYNMLVNPTGKPHAFRGVDWVEEFNNLLTKVQLYRLAHAMIP